VPERRPPIPGGRCRARRVPAGSRRRPRPRTPGAAVDRSRDAGFTGGRC
jgi:hypothetical protein